MSLFSGQLKPLVGVDIGPSVIKMVELAHTSSRGVGAYRLERFGVGNVPDGAVDGRKVVDAEALAGAIKQTLKNAGIKAKRAAAAVAGSSVITKTLSLPAGMGHRELEALVQLEADQYIPYTLEEVKIDFEVLGPSRNATENVDVLLAASHSENVDERVKVIRASGLEPVVIDVEAFAIANACEHLSGEWPAADEEVAVAIADVGAYSTTVIVVQQGRVVYTREQNIGGNRLSEDIQHRYGMSSDEAEVAKRSGDLPDDYSEFIRRPFLEMLAQEIRGALQFYHAAGTGADVNRLFLTGGAAAMPELARLVSQHADIPAKVFNPFGYMEMAPSVHVNKLKDMAPSLAVACGLAMRRFDV